MKLTIHAIQPGLACVRCRGSIGSFLNGEEEDPLEAALGPLFWPATLLLDLSEVPSLDSMGIAWLIRWNRKAKEGKGKFGLYGVTPRVLEMLQFCQMHKVLPIYDTEAAARVDLGMPRPTTETTPKKS